jgi:glutamate/tyrosine decarboxylase-like PLP-dependent enzyme
MKLTNHLDPEDWAACAEYIAQFSADEVTDLAHSLEGEVWQAMPEAIKTLLQNEPLPQLSSSLNKVVGDYRTQIRPYRAGNTHPRFFGWVQGPGTVPALMADIAISTLNPNCGGRDHGAVYIERQVVDWCRQIFGFADSAAGLLTSGTSTSTLLAIQVAIFRKLGLDYKNRGFFAAGPPLRCYASQQGHSSIIKAVQTCGIGSDNLVIVPTDDQHRLDAGALDQLIRQDIEQGLRPFLVIANAGTVNTGAFDPFDDIRRVCDRHDCWMHVDGAFGAWLRIAGAPLQSLTDGINSADSLAFDFHKLMYVQYDCGGLLIKDGAFQQQVFSIRPDYLAPHGQALAGGEPWFCDFGLELSRSFRALKVWFTLKTYGLEKLGAAIRLNCRLAAQLSQQIERSEYFQPATQVTSNIVTFRLKTDNAEKNNRLCEEIVTRLQHSGEAVFSLTRQSEYRVIRASITNHRTCRSDIDYVVARLDALAAELEASD